MPFKSEAQRRYLWANEPEIARDWTDTYGSKIHAADGGIMRLGLKRGGGHHSGASNRSNRSGGPGPGGQGARGQATQNPGISQTPQGGHHGGVSGGQQGGHHPGINISNQHAQNLNRQNQLQQLALNNAADNQADVFQQKNNFLQGFNPIDYVPFIGDKSLSGMAVRGIGKGIKSLGNLFKGSGWDSSMGPRKDMGYNPNRINPFYQPEGGGDGQQQQYPPWWYDDAYAQNIVGDEELDIDTSTGDMDEWIQRFRVKDPYRQDQGGLDEQIKEYVSKLYR